MIRQIHHEFRNSVAHVVLALVTVSATLLFAACSDPEGSAKKDGAQVVEPTPESAVSDIPTIAPATEPEDEMAVEASTAQTQSPVPPADATVTSETAPVATTREAAQYVIKGVVTQWVPMVTFVQPGDQIVFRQMTGHDTETLDGMLPDGAQPWKSELGQEGFSITLDKPGAYVFKCNPHVSTGMIGAIVVGDVPPANLAALEAHPQNKGMIGRGIRKLKEALANH